jgi:hypothetical protein
MEVLMFGAIILFVLFYNNTINSRKFIEDNQVLFEHLKEDDYDFLVMAKYGDKVDPNLLYNKRLKMGFLTIVIFLFIFLAELSVLNIVLAILIGYLVFKSNYNNLKKYYKKHLHDIDVMLPYYLKGLEILIQHYTVPVALAKSIDDAPDIFKPGLREMIAKIDAGDSSIDPYMDFANQYPVRDSMRMMRLLYRLGLGKQEDKQERLLMFSRTVSNLQSKARETKYKERLHHMESQTMIMLVATGGGVMVLILFAMIYMFTNL